MTRSVYVVPILLLLLPFASAPVRGDVDLDAAPARTPPSSDGVEELLSQVVA